MKTSSEQLERETEHTRAELSANIEELRARLTAGQIVDDVLRYSGDGASEFVHTLGRQVRTNPLPVTLIGAGIAWLMMSNRGGDGIDRESLRRQGRRMSDSLTGFEDAAQAKGESLIDSTSEGMHNMKDRASSAMSRAGDSAREGAAWVQDSAKSGAECMQDTAKSGAEWARENARQLKDEARSLADQASSSVQSARSGVERAAAAMGETASHAQHKAISAGQSAISAGQRLIEYCRTQPLVLAGIGLAIGAALGASLPETDTEDRLMGEASDRAKDEAHAIAADQMQKVKQAGQEIYQHALEETKTQAEQIADEAESRLNAEPIPSDSVEGREAEMGEASVPAEQGQPAQLH